MRLPRPYIPVLVKCTVVLRQLGELWPEEILAEVGASKQFLNQKLVWLARLLDCEVGELRLDHDPALGARAKIWNKAGEIVAYVPDANDPDHLVYRTKHAHYIKTNVRGDGAKFPDRVLIKRARRQEKGTSPRRKKVWPSRPFPKIKSKIHSRPFRDAA